MRKDIFIPIFKNQLEIILQMLLSSAIKAPEY